MLQTVRRGAGFNCLCSKWKIVQLKTDFRLCVHTKSNLFGSEKWAPSKWCFQKQDVLAFVFCYIVLPFRLRRRINISLQPIEYCARDSSVKQTDKKKTKIKLFQLIPKDVQTLIPHCYYEYFYSIFHIRTHLHPSNDKKIPQIQKIWIDIRVVVQPQFKVNPSNRLN